MVGHERRGERRNLGEALDGLAVSIRRKGQFRGRLPIILMNTRGSDVNEGTNIWHRRSGNRFLPRNSRVHVVYESCFNANV